MQCGQADCCHFETGTQGSDSSLWTFKLEFGIVHTTNCSVCRSYMTHVAVANHSGDASFKDALNNREDRVSTAFLDGLLGGRQIQQEHDKPVLSRYRDERNKALQDLDDAKKEMGILRDRILSLELAAQYPVSEIVSKRRDKAISSSTEPSTKGDMSSVDRLLLSPSFEDLDALSTSVLSSADGHDPVSIPNLPTTTEERGAHQTETSDPTKTQGSSPPANEPLGKPTVSTANVAQNPTLSLKASFSGIPEPAKPSPQPSTRALSLSPSDQPSAIPEAAEPPPRPSTCAFSKSNFSTLDLQRSSVGPMGETNVSSVKVPKTSMQLAKPTSSTTPKPEKPSPQPSTCALGSSNTSYQQSSSVELPGETNMSISKMPESWEQLAKLSSTTPEAEKSSPQPSTCALSSSNISNQQSSSVKPLGETNASTAKVTKSWAQLAKASSSATPNPENPSPRPSTSDLSLPIPSSDQQTSSVLATSASPRPLTTIAHVDALIKAAHNGDDSSLTRIRVFCSTAHRTPRKQRTELQRYALLHWRNRPPSVSSSVPSSVPSSEPGTGTVNTTVGDGTFSTEIHVDSSAWGIGFVMDGLWLAWKFSDSLTVPGNSIDNNWAEMLAVEVGLWTVIHWVRSVIQKEGDVIKSLKIIVCSDNAGVVKAIEKHHSNFPPQQDILLRILDMVSQYNIQLSMKWISSMDNFADGPSRGIPGPASDRLPFIPLLPSFLSDILLLP